MHIIQNGKGEELPLDRGGEEEEEAGWREEGKGRTSLSLSPFVRPFSYLHACWELRGAAPGGRAGKREREKEEKKSGYLFPIYVSGTRSWPSNGA